MRFLAQAADQRSGNINGCIKKKQMCRRPCVQSMGVARTCIGFCAVSDLFLCVSYDLARRDRNDKNSQGSGELL